MMDDNEHPNPLMADGPSSKRRIAVSEFLIVCIVCCCMFSLNIYASVFLNGQHSKMEEIDQLMGKIINEMKTELATNPNSSATSINDWSTRLQSISTKDIQYRSDKLFSASQAIAITICVILLIPSIYSYTRAEPGQFRMRFRNFSYYKIFWFGMVLLASGLGLGGGGLLQFGRYNPQFGLSLCIAGECLWIIGGYFIADLSPKNIPQKEIDYQEQQLKKQAEQLSQWRAAMTKEALARSIAIAQVKPIENQPQLVELKENDLINVEVRRNPPPAFSN